MKAALKYSLTVATIIICLMMVVTPSFAQSRDSSQVARKKNNLFSIIYSFHEFFDGSPIIQPPHPSSLLWLNPAFGFEYARKLNEKNGFLLSATLCGVNNWFGPYPRVAGDVFFRLAVYFEGSYQRKICSSKNSLLAGIAGLNIRLGNEEVFLSRFYGEPSLYSYELRDFGVTAGLRGTQVLFWNVILTGDLKFTQYIYRYANHQDQLYTFPNRPTRNMLTLQLGLGYRF